MKIRLANAFCQIQDDFVANKHTDCKKIVSIASFQTKRQRKKTRRRVKYLKHKFFILNIFCSHNICIVRKNHIARKIRI